MQARQKLCLHGSCTGSTKTCRQMGQRSSSSKQLFQFSAILDKKRSLFSKIQKETALTAQLSPALRPSTNLRGEGAGCFQSLPKMTRRILTRTQGKKRL
ncbi:hypothetical protein scyTo_0004217 [Scyliorhinus torazame]|uniref:Uncharacterized protein n=1 Tax=Scyliorhinus torazame TaxID=75743 RepID=A0A401NMW5_SCYTO|nr:hypothetical protein [Scyliorhinus torazame]